MKIPWWKHWLSHLVELPLERTGSEHNPFLQVSLKRGRFRLVTANAIYSYGDLYDNFSTSFARTDLDRLAIQKVLILGFGLGSIPLILEKIFQKEYQYTAVEIDEIVLYLANKYTLPYIHSPIEMICADAYNFVMQCREVYDLILVDLFLDDQIPEKFGESDFLEQLGTLLSHNGILMYNKLAFSKEDITEAKSFFEQVFQNQFPNGTYLEVRGNYMMLNRSDVVAD